ncbi:MAG: alginate export family protein [Dokdonella sp.]
MITDPIRPWPRALCAAVAFTLLGGIPLANAADAPASGPVLEARFRHEGVDDAAFARDASANTLRLRLGYRWVFAPGWQLFADGEHVQALFGENYNSTSNGKTRYPVVADPEGDEINQAWIGYNNDAFNATLGRQRVMLDNQRFFGNVGWRQNEQTFDAFSSAYAFGDGGPTLRYTYLDRALRVFGHENPNPLLREWSLDGHLINISQVLPLGVLTAYAYMVENNDIALQSTRTLGARWTGKQTWGATKFAWTAEWADQSDYANNPLSQSAQYYFVEPSLEVGGITIKAGWEVLGGNGRYGFSTPFATLHAFNGWADRFLSTPVNGLDDRYVGVGGKVGKAAWATTYHDFRADHGNQDYGRELDASIGYPFNAHFNGLLKVADYRSDGFGADVRKLWASIEYKY